ncbi:MAG: hypothetical protein GY756_14385 [bacterium]|nr:hypothetical protein [bacterium]
MICSICEKDIRTNETRYNYNYQDYICQPCQDEFMAWLTNEKDFKNEHLRAYIKESTSGE